MKTTTTFALLLGVILVINMTSCTPPTKVHLATLTPIITATPIALEVNNIDISKAVRDIYKENPVCKSYDAMNTEQDILEFFKDTGQIDFDRLIVQEIADSTHDKYRAYLATDPTLKLSNCEVGCFPERIYIKDLAKGDIYGINWNGYMPGRITYKLVWIGDNILVFQQNVNPYNGETIAVDIEQQVIIYRSLESCN